MKFTFEPTFKFENNMDLIDPRSMLLNYERRDLNNLTSYSFALFAIIFHYFDLITDILASITLSKADDLIFALSILFLLLPSLALMLAPQSQYDRLANIFQLRILLEAYRSIIVFIIDLILFWSCHSYHSFIFIDEMMCLLMSFLSVHSFHSSFFYFCHFSKIYTYIK